MLRSNITLSQPADFKDSGFKKAEWFKVSLNASRIVTKPLEQAITVGVDFMGLTSGDPNQLVDLTKVRGLGSIYTCTVTPKTNLASAPILVPKLEPKGGSIAAAVNMSFVSAVAAMVSPQIAGTPIRNNVRLDSISIGYSRFEKPLRGNEDGLGINFHVTVDGIGGINGRFFLQPYLTTFDGPTEFVYNKPDTWNIYVAKVEVDMPWWVNLVAVVLAILVAAILVIIAPVLAAIIAPLLVIGLIALVDSIIPEFVASTEKEVQDTLQKSSSAAANFPVPWSVYDRNPIPVRLKLNEDLEKLAANNMTLSWEVFRADTNEIVSKDTNPTMMPPSTVR
jgi:hypothetical protein